MRTRDTRRAWAAVLGVLALVATSDEAANAAPGVPPRGPVMRARACSPPPNTRCHPRQPCCGPQPLHA